MGLSRSLVGLMLFMASMSGVSISRHYGLHKIGTQQSIVSTNGLFGRAYACLKRSFAFSEVFRVFAYHFGRMRIVVYV
jgi:hypothetical protein